MRTFHFNSFEDACAAVERSIGHRNLNLAYDLVRWMSTAYSTRAQTYNLYNLVVCLNNREGGALFSEHMISKAKSASGYKAPMGGDMQRDRAIGLIRYAQGDQRMLEAAERAIDEALHLHAEDANRIACLYDVRGRLAFARRDYEDALRLHQRADRQWQTLGDRADHTWIYNNLVHWLKATVALHGGLSRQAGTLANRIRNSRPDGAPNRYREAVVIRVPVVGNPIHDSLTRRR